MVWPPAAYPLPTNKANDTTSADDHPGHHNDLATGLNAAIGAIGSGDEEWTQVDFTFVDFVNGFSTVDTGTNGFSFYRWKRSGRTISLKIFALFDTDATGWGTGGSSAFIIPADQLPAYAWANPGGTAIAGGFGYINLQPVSSTPGPAMDGGARIVGPAITDLGGMGNPSETSIVFIQAPSTTTEADGGLFNLWGEERPLTLSGRVASYQGHIDYEAAAVAP